MDTTLSTDALLERWRHYRDIARILHPLIVRRANRGFLKDAADRLRLLADDGTVALDSDREVCIYGDFLVMGMRRGGHTLAELALTPKWPLPGTDERTVLKAMAAARYTLLEVLDSTPNLGFTARDRIAGDEFFVVNRALGTTACKGLGLSTRVLELPELRMLTGAAISLEGDELRNLGDAAEQARQLAGAGPGRLPRDIELTLAEYVTRALLDSDAAEEIRYEPV